MILYLESQTGNRRSWNVRSFEDLVPVAEEFPQVGDIAETSSNLSEAVQNIADYLSSHSMDSWVEDDGQFTKSVRSALAGIGLAATAALAPAPQPASAAPKDLPPVVGEPTTPRAATFGSEPEDGFLTNIMQLESSGGKNTNHQPVAAGHLKGEKAMGRWGLMKPTVDEIVGRMEQAGTATPAVKKLKAMHRDGLSAYLKKNPDTELYLARYLARHVLGRHHQDARRAAYAWKHGHNLFSADITERDLAKEPYVKDFSDLSRGDKVRGLTGSKMFVKKSEPQSHFRTRLSSWKKMREEQHRRDAVPVAERNRGIDPGRKIDPSEEVDIRTKTGDPEVDLGNSIEDAKRSRLRQ